MNTMESQSSLEISDYLKFFAIPSSIELRIQFVINIFSDTQSEYVGSCLFGSLIPPSIYLSLFDHPMANIH